MKCIQSTGDGYVDRVSDLIAAKKVASHGYVYVPKRLYKQQQGKFAMSLAENKHITDSRKGLHVTNKDRHIGKPQVREHI